MHPKAQALHPHKKKIYVKVSSDTDQTGYIQPKAIIWPDGKRSVIEDVKDFRPANTIDASLPGDCYTVVINDRLTYLFFEPVDHRFQGRYGRWFVEVSLNT